MCEGMGRAGKGGPARGACFGGQVYLVELGTGFFFFPDGVGDGMGKVGDEAW